MRMPFERLMEYAAMLGPEDHEKSMGELAAVVGEEPFRLMDAIAAVRVYRGERTYVSPAELRAQTDPMLKRVMEADRGTVVTGGVRPVFDTGQAST